MKRIIISVINDLSTDQRLRRMSDTLTDSGCAVKLLGRKLPKSLPFNSETVSFRRFRMCFNKGFLFYGTYNVRLFFYILFHKKPELLIAIDLDTLLPNYLVSRIRRIPLIYDSHEYYTESPELVDRPDVQAFWENIERRILPKLKYAIAVSDSISESYGKKYGVDFVTVRNLARYSEPIDYEGFDEKNKAKYKIIYQGALNKGRGLELLIESMKYLDETMLVIAGDGDIRDELRALVYDLDLSNRVYYTGKLDPATLKKFTAQCDLGISIEEDMGLNYRFALPNKIFDYIQARIPVLCSDLPEMGKLVRKYKVGEVLLERTPAMLASKMRHMLQDKEKREMWKANLEEAAKELCWEKEEEKLLEVVRASLG